MVQKSNSRQTGKTSGSSKSKKGKQVQPPTNTCRPKNIVLLSDGTGNSRAQIWKSNVWRFYSTLDLSDPERQIAFYDDGVGSSSFKVFAALGGAFGFGLARNVREIYTFLCRTYKPGDKIYIMGFSRGAFTARVLAGLIASQGIVRCNEPTKLRQSAHSAYKAFRREAFGGSLLERPIQWISDCMDLVLQRRDKEYAKSKNRQAPVSSNDDSHIIHFLGLWDTVDAYGGPIDELTSAFDRMIWPLTAKDRDVSKRVKRICHALALDEQRQSFEPMIINEAGEPPQTHIDKERITQVWFTGVHSDIGGGYADEGLTLITLNWMMDRCQGAFELDFKAHLKAQYEADADWSAKLHDSRAGIGMFYRYDPRHLQRLCNDEKRPWLQVVFQKLPWVGEPLVNRVEVNTPKIHYSVFERIRHQAADQTPINIPAHYSLIDDAGNILPLESKPTSHDLRETVEQAKVREQQQRLVWNGVWCGRLQYLLTIALITLFLFLPISSWAPGNDGSLSKKAAQMFGTGAEQVLALPKHLQKLASFLPGSSMLDPVFEYYSSSSATAWIFLGLLFLVTVLIVAGTYTRTKVSDQMNNLWQHLHGGEATALPQTGWRLWLSSVLHSKRYDLVVRNGAKIAAEILAMIAIFFVLAILALRLAFVTDDRFIGYISDQWSTCTPTKNARRLKAGQSSALLEFNPSDPCWASGVKLEKDARYKIEMLATVLSAKGMQQTLKQRTASSSRDMSVVQRLQLAWRRVIDMCKVPDKPDVKATPWSDETIVSDLTGWLEPRGYMKAFIPIRRHLFADWYEPIVRIGHHGNYRFPIDAAKSQIETFAFSKTVAEVFEHDNTTQIKTTPSSPDQTTSGKSLDRSLWERQKLTFRFTATDNDELFLYLNDAIWFDFWENDSWCFYNNNLGDPAGVVISRE